MSVKKKSKINKRILLASTALCGVFILNSLPAFAEDIVGHIEKNIIDSGSYTIKSGTWDSNSSFSVNVEGFAEGSNSVYSKIFENGIYNHTGGNLLIKAKSGTVEPPEFVFENGDAVIWDDSAYVSGLKGSENVQLSNGHLAYGVGFVSNIEISNGLFKGSVDIRKGNEQDIFYVKKVGDPTGENIENSVISAGDVNVYGGEFFFYGDNESQIKMYKSNADGRVKIAGADWYLGYSDYNATAANGDFTIDNTYGTIDISGGQFNINTDRTMSLIGLSGSFSNPISAASFKGNGTISFNFSDSKSGFSINSPITWETGTINARGYLNINSVVTIKQFTGDGIINLSGLLSVKENMNIQSGSLSGSGELKLETNASATFGKLVDFGTITADRGDVHFTTGGSTLSVLNGGKGNIYIASNTNIETVNLQESILHLSEDLNVTTLNFDGGKIIFEKADTPLTLLESTSIFNTTQIDTTAYSGLLTIKDGKVLTFEDKAGTTKTFSSDNLTVAVENGASTIFKSQEVAFDTLLMTKGSGSVESGHLTLENLKLGKPSETTGVFSVANGAKTTVTDTITANIGSTVFVEGVLDVKNYEALGDASQWSVLTGSGVVNLTGVGNFSGKLQNLAYLNVLDGGIANFNGLSKQDTVSRLEVINGTLNINQGSLTLDSLKLDHGTVNIVNEGAVLALKQSPNGEDISGEGNTITGNGTLELLNDTNISFGGGSGSIPYLGGVLIHSGTATITSDIKLGSVLFSNQSSNGKLEIANGATLTLSDKNGTCNRSDNCKITSGVSNIISGQGTLNLVNGNDSFFNGVVDLGGLNFAGSGKMTFNSIAESKINTFNITNNGVIEINNGQLTALNSFGNGTNAISVGGSGTLYINSGYIENVNLRQSLNKLKIGTGNVEIDGGVFNSIEFVTSTGSLSGSNISVKNNITVGAGNVVSSDKLELLGEKAVGVFNESLEELKLLEVENGASAYINKSTQIGGDYGRGNGGLNLLSDNSKVLISNGVTLTLDQASIGAADENTYISGLGTLAVKDVNVNTTLQNLERLSVLESSVLNKQSKIKYVDISANQSLDFSGGNIFEKAILDENSILEIKDNTQIKVVEFLSTGGVLDIDANKTVEILSNITVGTGNKLNDTGTLFLKGNANGYFSMNLSDVFSGTLLIDNGLAAIQSDIRIDGNILFNNTTGGTLNIASGKTLHIGTIKTDGNNKITGQGTLNLIGAGSEFKAKIDDLATLMVSGGDAKFYNSVNIDTIAFENGGNIGLESGVVMSVNNMTQNILAGTVTGLGTFVSGTGDVFFTTGAGVLNNLLVGSGELFIVDDSTINAMTYQGRESTLNISGGKTLTLKNFYGLGELAGISTAVLNIANANVTFDDATDFFGKMFVDSGVVNFDSAATFDEYTTKNAKTVFNKGVNLSALETTSGDVTFNQYAVLGSVDILGNGRFQFNDTAEITNLNIGGGSVFFNEDSTIQSVSSVGSNGVLDVDDNIITISTNDFIFDDGSTLKLRISNKATDVDGNVLSDGYGQLKFNSGKAEIRDAKLDVKIDYGLNTKEEGSIFKFIEGTNTGNFTFENNRYNLSSVNCIGGGAGLCYKLVESSTGGEVAEQEKGSKNNVETATAFLDKGLFEMGSEAFKVAEHLDNLSQDVHNPKAYINALTAIAPDVSNSTSRQSVTMNNKVTNTINSRLTGLMSDMGSSSETQRSIRQMYGRSGGSAYHSRFMRAKDYYQKAGYYDMDSQPQTKQRPAYHKRVNPNSYEAQEMQTERKRWSRHRVNTNQVNEFGAWAQAFMNTAEYISSTDPKGFATDTTGFAVGADMKALDVFAVGLGYASTSSTTDTVNRSTDVSGNSLFLYGMYKPMNWYINSVLNWTSMTYEESKDLSGMIVSDDYDGTTMSASVMFGQDLKTWSPAVGLRYVSAERDGHVDSIGQNIAGISTTVLTAVAEARTDKTFGQRNNSFWNLELLGALTYDISSSGEEAVVSLPNSSAYTVVSEDFSEMGVELGGTLSYVMGENVNISAGYNMEWRSDYLSHTLTATFRYEF